MRMRIPVQLREWRGPRADRAASGDGVRAAAARARRKESAGVHSIRGACVLAGTRGYWRVLSVVAIDRSSRCQCLGCPGWTLRRVVSSLRAGFPTGSTKSRGTLGTRGTRITQGCSGVLRVLRGTQGYSGVLRGTQGCSGVLRGAQGYSGVLRVLRGTQGCPAQARELLEEMDQEQTRAHVSREQIEHGAAEYSSSPSRVLTVSPSGYSRGARRVLTQYSRTWSGSPIASDRAPA
jgi:hypothetical protein